MLWVLGGLALIGMTTAVALRVAISHNGPAVLTVVDQVTGGQRSAKLAGTASMGEHPAQKVLVWAPTEVSLPEPKRPVILFVHGGSWRSGDPADYGFIGRSFVPNGFIVVLAGYRLVPEGPYPAMLQDTATAIAWTKREIAQYGGDPDRITLVGHSAGAYNVMMAALEEQWLEREGLGANSISGVVGLSGPYDFYPFDSDSTRDAFGEASQPELTQPIHHVRGDAAPLLLIHGERDTLVKIRNSRELAKRIAAAGGSVHLESFPEMEHNDPLIALAAPWRNKRTIDDLITEFARNPHEFRATSVPVKRQIR